MISILGLHKDIKGIIWSFNQRPETYNSAYIPSSSKQKLF